MLSQKLQDAINEQIKNELYSAYLYLSMAAYSEDASLPGFANWMRLQAQEEVSHAMKLFDFVNERGGRVVLHAIDQPPAEFESARDIFARTLEHEQKVTASINALVNLAIGEKDHATNAFLQWFVTEQVEEEEHAGTILARFELAGDHVGALFMLDRELGARRFGASSGE